MSSLGETQRALTEKPLRTLAEMIGDEDCIISERRLVGRQKARIKTAGFSQLKYLEQLDRMLALYLIKFLNQWLILLEHLVVALRNRT